MSKFVYLVIVCVGVIQVSTGAAVDSTWKLMEDEANDIENEIESTLKKEWGVAKEKSVQIGRKVDDFFENEIPELAKRAVSFIAAREVPVLGKKIEEGIEEVQVLANGCVCSGYVCGCCGHIEEEEIHLNSTICANVTYLKEDYGLSFTVTLNNFTIYNETISVRNPPPVCLGVPYVKEWAEACVRLYDIDTSKHQLHACVRVEARMKKVLIAQYELGCFTIGPPFLEHTTHVVDDMRNEISVLLL